MHTDNDEVGAVVSKLIDAALEGRSRDNLPVVYLSGPMSGIEDFNFPQFNKLARCLRSMGFPVLNPADFGADPKHSWTDCLSRDIMLVTHADIVLLLPGWEDSEGAQVEFDVAFGLQKPVLMHGQFLMRVLLNFFDDAQVDAFLELDDVRQDIVIVKDAEGKCVLMNRADAERLEKVDRFVKKMEDPAFFERLTEALDDLDDEDDDEDDEDYDLDDDEDDEDECDCPDCVFESQARESQRNSRETV